MSRKRLTWADKARQAAAAPANPNEGPASPAYKGDPGPDDYKSGDTSAWAEDVHPGPYPNSAHPATPDEGPASPAYKAAALERKAAKCIRIATAMLGEGASYREVEDQALTLMDLSDRAIKASLVRLGEDESEEDESEEDEAMHNKKAFSDLTSRIARLERILVRLAGDDDDDDEEDEVEEEEEVEVEEAKKKASRRRRALRSKAKAAYAEMGEDEMFAEMLKEESMGGEMGEDELLAEMLKEESMEGEILEVSESLPEAMPGHAEMGHDEMGHDEMMPAEMMPAEMMGHGHDEAMPAEMMEDPMGVMDAEMGEDEMLILAKLYGRSAGDKKEEKAEEKAAETVQEEVEHEAEEKEEAKKKAALRPRARSNGTGATRLGGPVSKAASNEISELAKLWESAPDVSKHF